MGKHLGAGQFYGSIAKRLTVDPGAPDKNAGNFVLSELVHRHGWQVPFHGHQRPYFCFLVAGAYRERAAAFSLEYEPFHLVYHPAQFEHADEIGNGGARFFTVEMPEAESNDFERRLPRSGADRIGGDAVWIASAMYRAFLRGADSHFELESLARRLEATVTRVPALGEYVTPPWLARITERIEAEFRGRLRLDDLAREAGVHPVHLSRTFAKRRGVGLHAYIENVRLRWVCAEMSRGESDLATLAIDAGYADQSHMTRAFKRLSGMTPGEMRALLRESASSLRHVPSALERMGSLPHAAGRVF